jgi:hypothetical protein
MFKFQPANIEKSLPLEDGKNQEYIKIMKDLFKKLITFFCFLILIWLAYYFIERPASGRYFLTIDGSTLEVEIADNPYLRRQGLMGRQLLSENRGVLFIFPMEVIQKFWMKNTIIPLSIAFIRNDGHISQILQMKPDSWNGILPEYRSNEKVRLALEVNQGWFEKRGIQTGHKIYFSHSIQKRIFGTEGVSE